PERPGEGYPDRGAGSGAHRPHGNEVQNGEVRENSVLQRAVLRRPGMGDTGDGWYRNGRTSHGNKERLPFPPHTGEHGTVTGAEPDSSVLLTPAGELQEICSLYFC